MSASTLLAKVVAVAGLILTIPIALLLITGEIAIVDAGMRAGLLFVGVVVLRKMSTFFAGGPIVVAAPVADEE